MTRKVEFMKIGKNVKTWVEISRPYCVVHAYEPTLRSFRRIAALCYAEADKEDYHISLRSVSVLFQFDRRSNVRPIRR